MFRKRSLSPIVAVSLLAIVSAYVAWANLWYAYDDAFITYRVAYNFATGQGFVYNPGEWFMGITAPGLALLLGFAGRVVGAESIPLISGIVSAVSLFLAALALYVYGARHREAACGLFAGLLLIANPMMAVTFGGEMPLQMALILWAFVAYAANWRIASALLLAAATVVRPDGVLAAIVLGVSDLVRTRRIDWRAWLAFTITLVPFAALGWIYFGSPVPATLAAKLAQRDSGFWVSFGKGLRNWLHIFLGVYGRPANYEIFAWDPRAVGFWIILGVPALWRYRFWWPPLAWIAVFVLGYRTLKVPFYHWYAAPAVVGLAIVAACGITGTVALIARLATRVRQPHEPSPSRFALSEHARDLLSAAAGLLLCAAVMFQALRALPITAQPAPMLEVYTEAGRWLQAHTAPTATIGYYEIGYLGYYARRRVIDPLGLVDPAIPPHIAQQDFLWAYRHYQPTYVLQQEPYSFGGMLNADWFRREYRPMHTWVHPRSADVKLTIYQRTTP